MYIGGCWFDAENQRLVNQADAEQLKLSQVEFSVMSQMMSSRGQVVSTALMCHQLLPKVVSAHDISEAVARIKHFLGSEHSVLIEVISNQGYLLHFKPKSSHRRLLNTPYSTGFIRNYSILFLLTLSLVVFLATNFETTENIHLLLPEKIQMKEREAILVPVYGASTEMNQYREEFKQLAELIDGCQRVRWQTIFVSASERGDILNFVLASSLDGVIEHHNIKAMDALGRWDFIDAAWLKEAGICE